MYCIKRHLSKFNLQSFVAMLCIFVVCVGTQQMQTVAWDSGRIECSRDLLGVLMAVILMTHYKWSDFVKYKIPYIIWSILGIILGGILTAVMIGKRASYLKADTIIIVLGIFLMGYCVIHTVISFYIEKYCSKFYKPLFMIWVIMLVLMIISKSEYLWPECYLVLFLCYYMTKQTPSQRANVISGLVNGIIMAFFVIQGHALLCRPYDRVRYYGNFCNPNHNCMFLCLCLAAILAKILFITRESRKVIIRVFYFLLAGMCYSLICMTMTRSGYIAAFVVTVFFLITYCQVKGKKIFIRTGLLLVLIFVVSMPLTYVAVRYIPTIHPHVLFYFQEGYSEARVHSWDERDSEKYVTFEQLIQSVLGRIERTKKTYDDFRSEEIEKEENGKIVVADFKIASNAEYFPTAVFSNVKMNMPEAESETNLDKVPALTNKEASNAFIVRYTIYKWYFTHLTLRGMPYDEQGFQLTEDHWIQDTHNIYLDYGINFGFPVMILFIIFIWWGIGRLVKQGIKMQDIGKMASLFIVLIPSVFGLFEFAWGAGTISTVAFYFSFKEMFTEEEFAGNICKIV